MQTRKTTASRFHDISCGHRVTGHESKCRHLHGHNYRIHFHCEAVHGVSQTDDIGRVIDFSDIKARLCMWLEEHWDHKFLAWEHDPIMTRVADLVSIHGPSLVQPVINPTGDIFNGSIVWTPFNPTAENMAQYLVDVIGPIQLEGTGIRLVSVTIEETAKCSASYEVTE